MIAIRGFDPDAHVEPNAVSVDRWYDRHALVWIVVRRDAKGQQVGDADIAGSLAGAKSWEDDRRRELGLPALPRGRR